MPELHELSVAALGVRLRDGSLSASALTEHALLRIERLNPTVGAFVTVTAERARADAARADRELAAGLDRGPLHGIPYGVKDLVDTAGLRTTAHSRLLADNVPAADATVARKLADAGAVLLGKLATYEFAIEGRPGTDTLFPPARNPRDAAHITGGSSSGSAAAVAAGLVRFAIGTDTGGSIRSPACYCGVVGLKPTHGRVSARGVFPLSPALDHVGPLAASVADAAAVLDAIAGHDPLDPHSWDQPLPQTSAGLGGGVRGLQIAYAREFIREDAPADILARLDAAAERLALSGAEVDEVHLPPYTLFEATGRVILQAEAYAIHEQMLRTHADHYGRLAYAALACGAVLSGADLVRAQDVQRALTAALDRDVFTRFDAILTGNVLATAGRLDTPAKRWTPMRTFPFNVSGHPALALPMGDAADGLPLGLQLVGRRWGERTLCRIGAALEQSLADAPLQRLAPASPSLELAPAS